MKTTIELIRGDDNEFVLVYRVPDEDTGEAGLVEITGYAFEIMAKTDEDDEDNDAIFHVGTPGSGATYETISIRSPQTGDDLGKADVVIPAAATSGLTLVNGSLVLAFDVQVVKPNARKATPIRGDFIVLRDINQG